MSVLEIKQKMPSNPYTEILAALATADVDFILGGGLACVLHGAERVTMDADVSVLMSPGNFGRFLNVMHRLGLQPRVPVDPKSLLDARVIRMLVEEKQALVFSFLDPNRPIRQVDLFLRTDLSFEILLPAAEWVDLDGFRIRILSKAKLLDLKLAIQPPRSKDAVDIEFLRRHVHQ